MKATIISNTRTGPLISILAALAFGAWAVYLGQDKNWDLLNYHLYNPYAFLNDRIETDLAPAGVQTYFSPMLDVLYFKAISLLGPKAVGFLLGFLQGLNYLLLFKIAERVLKDQAHRQAHALLLALAGVLTVGFLAELGTTMHDSLVALFPLASLWMILVAIGAPGNGQRPPPLAPIIGAGLVAGAGIGLKLVSAIYALPLCLALLVVPVNLAGRLKLAFIFGLSVLASLFITGGYWLYEVWRLFGNPLFPQFNNYFHGELAQFAATRDLRFLPQTLFDKVFYPVIFTFDPQRVAELRYEQYSWLVAYVAIFGLLVERCARFFIKKPSQSRWCPEARFLLAFFCISYILWLNIFGIYRYLAVIEYLIPLLLFVIVTRLSSHRLAAPAALVFLTVLTLVNLRGVPDWGHAGWADRVYRIEAAALTSAPEPAAVYLAGQPLAWIVPALDIASPFVQLVPNMFVSDAYWQRAKILTAERTGKSYIVYESDDPVTAGRAHAALLILGLSVDAENCGHINAFIGDAGFEYRFCELKATEPF